MNLVTHITFLGALGSALIALGAGCSDDAADTTPTGGSSATSGTGATGGSAGTAGSPVGGAGGESASGGGGGGTASKEYAAVIRGTLASADDLAKAKATHDQIAMGGESSAKAAGDFAHDALLGTTMLDSIENEFLAIDRWTNADAMQGLYANPMFQKSFNALFAAPPTIEFFVHAPDWVTWGDMNSGDTHDPYFFHFALGVLKDTDLAKNKAAHDQVASGGKQPSIDAGNVAHVIFLGLDDPRRFLGVDIWGSGDNIEAFYTNPQFVAAFGPLFESVGQPVYQSTDWYQW